MKYVRPHYYDNFKCAAGGCPDTCCAGWQIMIDEKSLGRYYREKGAFGSRLFNSIDWQKYSFLQYEGKCTLLDEQGLCELVIQKGEEYLCDTCRRYPRHEEEFANLREWSLSLSCPIAAQMVLLEREPLQLIVQEDNAEDPLKEEFGDFDEFLFRKLQDARELMFTVAKDRSLSMECRMERILFIAGRIQECVDQDKRDELDEIIGTGKFMNNMSVDNKSMDNKSMDNKSIDRRPAGGADSEETDAGAEYRFGCLRKMFDLFFDMRCLREEWDGIRKQTRMTLYEGTYEDYKGIREEFLEQYGAGGPLYEEWESFRENLLLSYLYTYFCGAVYDDGIYSKAALAVFSVCYVQEIVMCSRHLTDKIIGPAQWAEIACRYAREVEHSDDNLEILEDWLIQAEMEMKGMVSK